MSYQEQTTESQGTGPVDENLTTHNVLRTARNQESCTNFLRAIDGSDLQPILAGPEFVTLFMPVDEAFRSGQETEDVAGYVVRHQLNVVDLKIAGSVKAMNGESVPVRVENGIGWYGKARIIRGDIACTNGVLHIIDNLAR